ncbi:MAG: single-stranded-DNA-specific exonuclease RecJ [Lachnospiraceae bacterium]|nr:single-stranded-DNA-specific exonuclease RecJ [Lachnospiraceae bacterium]
MQQGNRKEIWMVQTKRADFYGLAARLGVSPVSVRIMRNRGMETEEQMYRYLYGTVDELYDGGLMKDMGKAIRILLEQLKNRKKIRIIGDYDIDGVCSTYLLLTGLRRAARALNGREGELWKNGAAENDVNGWNIDYEIPDRIKDGYGINESIIREAAADGVDTIITCDNGISASKEIALAKEFGMTVIITDHHEVPVGDHGQIIPPADAVVNPKQADDKYPFPEICGAVVAYKLIRELYRAVNVPDREWKELLEFAAIATVGDVMKLQDENRIIVKYGLRRMAVTKNLGLRKLVEKTGLDITALSAYHIGFVIGPCLNAGGRLQTAKIALRLLLSEDENEADRLAEELKALNDIRKDMTKQGEDEAIRQVEECYSEDKVLVVYLPECHESLAGIIAGRVREHFHKPSIVLTKGEERVKGSGRSIEQYHMFQALTKVADLLPKFGGHPMAAGLSIEEADVEEFRRRLNEDAELSAEDFIPKVWIDVPMPLDYVSESLVEELKQLEPYGQGNEKPLFAQKNLYIRSVRVLGKTRNLAKLSLVTESGRSMDGLLFTNGDEFLKELGNKNLMDIIYYPDINEYNGNRVLQVVVKNYQLN